MDIANTIQARLMCGETEAAECFSHRKLQDDDIIMPQAIRNTEAAVGASILVGLVFGAMVIFLVMPANTEH